MRPRAAPNRRFPTRAVVVASTVWCVVGCRTSAPPMTFAEAGLTPAPKEAPKRLRSRLDAATLELVDAIERTTGERPPFAEDAEAPTVETARRVRSSAAGWTGERTALAAELHRALDTGEATIQSVKRARTALRWDLLVGPRLAEVDRTLVTTALARADALLPAPAPAVVAVPIEELAWPVDPVRVTSRFGVRDDPFGEGTKRHSGVDLAALEGQLVKAAASGTVVFAGHRGGYGLHVAIEHAGERVTRYAHLSDIDVVEGMHLAAGTVVGRAGRSGRATGPHLHFELWLDGLPVNPEDELPRFLRTTAVTP